MKHELDDYRKALARASSATSAPTLNLPLVALDGMPLGVQLMGFEGQEVDLTAMAVGFWRHTRW